MRQNGNTTDAKYVIMTDIIDFHILADNLIHRGEIKSNYKGGIL